MVTSVTEALKTGSGTVVVVVDVVVEVDVLDVLDVLDVVDIVVVEDVELVVASLVVVGSGSLISATHPVTNSRTTRNLVMSAAARPPHHVTEDETPDGTPDEGELLGTHAVEGGRTSDPHDGRKSDCADYPHEDRAHEVVGGGDESPDETGHGANGANNRQ